MFRVFSAPIIKNKQAVVTTTGTSREFGDVMTKTVKFVILLMGAEDTRNM
jgi:hypothetical protein